LPHIDYKSALFQAQKSIYAYFFKSKTQFPFNSINHLHFNPSNSITVLAFGLMGVELASDVKDEELLLLIEYKAP